MKHTDEYDLYTPLSHIINFKDVDILDFGGSFGNLIQSSNGNIDSKNYTCVDVDKDAILLGKKNYPEATWIHLDLYNPMYNPSGNGVIKLPKKYDVIFSYSVFTHTTLECFLETTNTLKNYLTPTGKIYATMVTTANHEMIKWFTDKRILDYGECDDFIETDTYFYLVNNKIQKIAPPKCDYLVSVYNEKFLSTIGKLHYPDLLQTLVEIY